MSDTGPSGHQDESPALTDEQAALYWYFADSRNRKGVPTVTRSTLQHLLGWKWAKISALMQEIEDAGYWSIREQGHPVFDPNNVPPRPKPAWLDSEASVESALTPVVHARSGAYARNSQATREAEVTVNPLRGFTPSPRGATSKTRRDVLDLIDYFSYRVRKAYGGFAPDPINVDALKGSIGRWLRLDAIPPAMVKQMIDIFVSEPQFIKKGTPAWKSFLAQRQRLMNMAQDRSKRSAIESDWKRGR